MALEREERGVNSYTLYNLKQNLFFWGGGFNTTLKCLITTNNFILVKMKFFAILFLILFRLLTGRK